MGSHTNRQGTVQTRTFEPTNESADCWYTTHSYIFIIRVKLTKHIKSILIGWEETNGLCLSFNKVSWGLSAVFNLVSKSCIITAAFNGNIEFRCFAENNKIFESIRHSDSQPISLGQHIAAG